jgi:hypothetical protein
VTRIGLAGASNHSDVNVYIEAQFPTPVRWRPAIRQDSAGLSW